MNLTQSVICLILGMIWLTVGLSTNDIIKALKENNKTLKGLKNK